MNENHSYTCETLAVAHHRLEERFDGFKQVMEERDKRIEMALRVANEQNMHWKNTLDNERQEQRKRDLNYLPRNMGVVVGMIAVASFVLTLFRLFYVGR